MSTRGGSLLTLSIVFQAIATGNRLRRDAAKKLCRSPHCLFTAKVLLLVDEGVVQPSSTLWFNAMRYTRPFTSFALPADPWLSLHPIPELPAPNTESPALLGLSEHTKNRK